jgi:RNA polymerase sigma-70 factor (ECF subfamily)
MSAGSSFALQAPAGESLRSPMDTSFPDVFERTAPFVWRALRRLGVREADVPDVCQEVFVVVHRRLSDFDGSSALRTWIYGICLRTASQYRRRAPQLREVSEDDAREQSVLPDQEDALERRRARDRLDAALQQLDDDKRAVFVLYELEELPMKEVAAVLGCPLQTAYSRLHGARREVEEAFRALSKPRQKR